ncbi:MAG: hypothetical protein IT262_09770, partial [Saprospiraceae bacterium]|nr:hypothetical protein [Saprospiraceae bacterium]
MRNFTRMVLFFCLLLTSVSLNAQSVIIGTGTSTTNGGGTGSSLTADPVERYYNYEHFQIVYIASELTAGGMTSGASITAMGF